MLLFNQITVLLMKKHYENPIIIIEELDTEDIICTSFYNGHDNRGGGGEHGRWSWDEDED